MRSLVLLALLGSACSQADPAMRARVVERDQLRREVTGFEALRKFEPGTLMDREHEVIVTVSDTLLRELIATSFPITVELQNKLTVTLTGANVVFRANVARVDIAGEIRRGRFPRVSAAVFLRGAIDRFVVDEAQELRARISIDDVELNTPAGAPAAFDAVLINGLQAIVERSLPELTSRLPSVALPVRLDQQMTLPGFGPEGALSIEPSQAPMAVEVARVIAFQNRLWVVLHVALGAFVPTPRVTATTMP
jgi:hypothetical protein